MNYLVDHEVQESISALIDQAVEKVLGEIVSHGGEEGMTAALGSELARQQVIRPDLSVTFRYRQHSKYTEEKHSGADGSFLVRIATPSGVVTKASLFQAKLLSGVGAVRTLDMSKTEASRLQGQAKRMLAHTQESVAVFYTHENIYVVDAMDYSSAPTSKRPLSEEHRLITLGTYLGKWMPRCTKGDTDAGVVQRSAHMDGFDHRLTLDVITKRPAVPWEKDRAEQGWRRKG